VLFGHASNVKQKGVFLCARETLFYRTTFFSAAAERHLNLPAITY
jgi:hypothetical protein